MTLAVVVSLMPAMTLPAKAATTHSVTLTNAAKAGTRCHITAEEIFGAEMAGSVDAIQVGFSRPVLSTNSSIYGDISYTETGEYIGQDEASYDNSHDTPLSYAQDCYFFAPTGGDYTFTVYLVNVEYGPEDNYYVTITVTDSNTTPTVTTQAVSDITQTTATGNGTITALGTPNPTQYGVVWGTSANPTTTLSTKTTQGAVSSTGAFTSNITGLTAGTTYHVRAYATNSVGTSYGEDVTFTTAASAPTVTDANISINGGTGTGGAYKIGDTVTATWNNTAGGDNNIAEITGVTVDFTQFGGGASVAATNNSGTWTATYTIVEGSIDATNRNVSVTATDNASNITTTADTTNAIVDNIAPTVSISSTASAATNTAPITVTIEFSENMTDFTLDDLTVENGTKSNFGGSGKTYTVDITPSGQGEVTVDIAANIAQDAAGNNNTAATQLSRTYDSIAPTIGVVSNGGLYNVKVSPTFNEGTATLSQNGGTANAYNYGANIDDSGSYALVVTDTAGNSTTVNFIIDKTAPVITTSATLTISTTAATDGATVCALTATDATAIPGFTDSLTWSVTGGVDAGKFSIDGTNLTINNTGSLGDGSYTVQVTATDKAGSTDVQTIKVMVVSGPTVSADNQSYDDTEAEDPCENKTGTISATANADFITGYGISGGMAGDTDIGGVIYNVSKAGTYGTLYVKSDDGKYVYVPTSTAKLNEPRDTVTDIFTIEATDAAGMVGNSLTVIINGVNDTPTGMSLSSSSLNENSSGNSTVGTLSSTDADVGSSFTYSLVAGDGSADNTSFSIDGVSLRILNSPDYEAKSSYSVRIRTTDQGGLYYEKAFPISINDVNEAPIISTADTISIVEGSKTAFTAAASDAEESAITWSITGGADAAKFSIVAGTGVVSFVNVPSFGAPTDADANNSYILEIKASDGVLTTAKTVTITVTQQVSSGGDGGTTTGSTIVEVNGKKQDAGTASTTTTGGQTVTTIKVDDTKLGTILKNSGAKPTVTLPTNTDSDVIVGELNGQTVKNMEAKDAVLEIKTQTVLYTLPTSQINIDDVSSQIGSQVTLKDIKVSVKISEPPVSTVKVVQETADKNSYQIVVKPVEFEITCASGDKTVSVSKFNVYVERTVAIPDEVDPSKITTGIVLNADGTFSHVPTSIIVINGKYYAKINSLTNSTYSVIYNPVSFADVANHWAKMEIDDMGSRMVVTGIGNNTYEPDRSISRAEFAATVVRAMGLQKGTTESTFGDVTLTDWFNGYVETATAYSLIAGYDNSKSYGPNDTITREQAMTILARAMKITGLNISLSDSEASELLSKYTDGDLVSDYAKVGAAACVKTGVVSGTTPTTISPKDYVTRAEVAIMIQRLLQKSGLI